MGKKAYLISSRKKHILCFQWVLLSWPLKYIWVINCLDKEADYGIGEIDHVGAKPNSDFTSLLACAFSTPFSYACHRWGFWDRFPMLHIAKHQILFIFHSQFHHKAKLLPSIPVPESRIYSLQTFFSQGIIYVTILEFYDLTFNLTSRP